MVSDGWRKYIEAGKALSAMTMERAEELLKEAAHAGADKRQQMQELLDFLAQQGKQGVDTIVSLVKQEASRQWEAADSTDKDLISSVFAGINKWLRSPCPESADTTSQSSTVKVTGGDATEEGAKESATEEGVKESATEEGVKESATEEGAKNENRAAEKEPTESPLEHSASTAKKPTEKAARTRTTPPKSAAPSSRSRSKPSSANRTVSPPSTSSDDSVTP